MDSPSLIDHCASLVEHACRDSRNPFGYGSWSHHVVSVVARGKELAQRLGADEEIVVLAALLHDYAAQLDDGPQAEHHVRGAALAGEVLAAQGYPTDRTRWVQACILSHRSSKPLPRETVEAQIVACADAMAHFDNVPSLLYYAFTGAGLGIDEGTQWVLSKLERSWRKLLPEGQELMQAQWEAIRTALRERP